MHTSAFLATLLVGTLGLSACSKDKKEDPKPAATPSNGEVKYTYGGSAYTISDVAEASALLSTGSNNLIITASPAGKPGISISLLNLTAPGTRSLQQGSVLDNRPAVAQLTRYDATASVKPAFSTLYGPAATNGNVIITAYNPSTGQLSGSFSFTGGPVNGSGATGTAAVTSGTFHFTQIIKI